MIEAIRIQRFRGFENLLIPTLRRFTILGGTNSAGKSSVLEAIFLFFARQSPNAFLSLYSFRGLNEISLDPQTLWGSCFYDFDKSKPIEISPDMGGSYKPTLKFSYIENYEPSALARQNPFAPAVIRTDQSIAPTTAMSVDLRSGSRETEKLKHVLNSFGLTLEVEAREGRPTPSYFIASRIGSNAREDSTLFGQLDVKNKAEQIVDYLKIIEPRLTGLSTIASANGISVVHGTIGLTRKVPVYQLGDGFVRLMSIIVAIANMEGGTVLIDEIGNGIHVSKLGRVAQAVMDAAEKFNVQVIATTHSYELLRGVIEGLSPTVAKSFVYQRLERDGNSVEVKQYEYGNLNTAIDMGWEVR